MYTYSYSLSLAAGIAATSPILQIIPKGANIDVSLVGGMTLREIRITQRDTTATDIGLLRSATKGTAIAGNTFQGSALDLPKAAPKSAGQIITGWTVAPTIAGTPAYYQTIYLPGSTGYSVVWEFGLDDGFIISETQANSMLIWNKGAVVTGALDIAVTWAEGD